MRLILLGLTVAIALYELSKWALEQAGNPNTNPLETDEVPKPVGALKAEFGNRLPNSVYEVFQRAVDYQLRGMYYPAHLEYVKLRKIPQRSGEYFDLAQASETLQHNLSLLKKSEAAALHIQESTSGGLFRNLARRLTDRRKR